MRFTFIDLLWIKSSIDGAEQGEKLSKNNKYKNRNNI